MDVTSSQTAGAATQIAASGQTGAQAGAPLSGQPGLFGNIQGLSFIDLIFARLESAPRQAGGGGQSSASGPLSPANSAFGPLSSLGLMDSGSLPGAAASILQTGNGDSGFLVSGPADADLLQGVVRRQDFLDFLSGLMAGLPDGQKPAMDFTTGKIVCKESCDGGAAKDGEGFPGLVAAGLTPETLTDIMERFGRDVLQSHGQDGSISGVAVGLVKLMPPESGAPFDAIILPKALFVSRKTEDAPEGGLTGGLAAAVDPSAGPSAAPAGPLPEGTEPTDELAAQLNGIAVGAGEHKTSSPLSSPALPAQDMAEEALAQGGRAGLEDGQPPSSEGKSKNAAQTDSSKMQTQPSAASHVAPSGFAAFVSGIMDMLNGGTPTDLDAAMKEAGLHPIGSNLTHPATLTQLVTQASNASAPHPATQVVAAMLTKAGSGGETKSFTLHLNPPELGRIEVRMELGKDKSVKTSLLVEKPETYTMLQRDAHVLSRALTEAGLDVGGDSLSFDLAQEGYDFGHEGGHDGGGYGGGADGNDPGAEAAPVTHTMNWYVDPDTGVQRYNLTV